MSISTRWPLRLRLVTIVCTSLSFLAGMQAFAATGRGPNGILWTAIGEWHHADGTLAHAGDAIFPGELLRPSVTDGEHTALVLLPDGQRVLLKCYLQIDCARGFRVPALNAVPSPFAVEMLDRVRAAFSLGPVAPAFHPGARVSPPAEQEEVAVLGAQPTVKLTGLAASLPKGHYTYDLTPRTWGARTSEGKTIAAPAYGLPLDKSSQPAAIELPGPGIYTVLILDQFSHQRIQIFLAATGEKEPHKYDGYTKARKLIEEWQELYPGWPAHDLLRYYLLSLAGQGPRKAS